MTNTVGCRRVDVHDRSINLSFPTLLFYPSQTPALELAFGPYTLDVAMDAELAPGKHPLVLISHGSGGSNLACRCYGLQLAKKGFVVALPEHPFNNRHNNDWEHSLENIINRPRHLSLIIDNLAGDSLFSNQLRVKKVAVIGHSVGGYTALALAGAEPDARPLLDLRINVDQTSHLPAQAIEVVSDQRIKALVLLDPDVSLFLAENALAQVQAAVLLRVAAGDDNALAITQTIARGLSNALLLNSKIVENASHYSFLSPFPEALKDRVGEASRDAEGFDRLNFHKTLHKEILDFLRGCL